MMATVISHIVLATLTTMFFLQSGVNAIRCAVCESTGSSQNIQSTSHDGQVCISSSQLPAPIRHCPDTHHYCITLTKYHVDGTMKSLSRNCSPVALPSSCLVGVDKTSKEPLKVCYTTCSEDGCNWKSSLKQMLNLL